MNRNLSLLHYLAVFLAGFLFILVFYWRLPYDFTADYVNALKTLESYNFSQLVGMTLNPLTPAWFFTDNMIDLRPLTFLYLKFFETVFGIGTSPVGLFEAFNCGLVSLLVFYLILQSGLNRIYGWLGVFLYLTFPSNVRGMLAFPHFEYFNTALRFTPVFLFGFLTLAKTRSRMKYLLTLLAIYILTVLAIKLRSSEKILPPLFLSFLILRAGPIRANVGKARYWGVFSVCVLLMLSVVPFSVQKDHNSPCEAGSQQEKACGAIQKEGRIKSFHLSNLYSTLIQHPGNPSPFLTVWRKSPPRNLMESYGFFSGWLFWIFLISAIFLLPGLRRRGPPRGDEPARFLTHFFWLFLLWSGFISLTYGSDFTAAQLRYLNFLLLPSVLVFFFSLAVIERSWFVQKQL